MCRVRQLCDRWDARTDRRRGGLAKPARLSVRVCERIKSEHIPFARHTAHTAHTGERREANLRSLEIYLSGGTSKHIHRQATSASPTRHAHHTTPHIPITAQPQQYHAGSSRTFHTTGRGEARPTGRRSRTGAPCNKGVGDVGTGPNSRTEQNRSISLGCDDAYALLGIHAHAHMHG